MRHEYFSRKRGGFYFAPTSECRKILNSFGLLFKAADEGFIIIYQATDVNGEAKPIHPIDENVNLSFAVYCDDPYLFHYSDLPFASPGKCVYFFSNVQEDSPDKEKLFLSVEDKASESDRIALCPKSFKLVLNKSKVVVSILDRLGEVVVREEADGLGKPIKYQVDLSYRDSGLYTLRVDGEDYLAFYADNVLYRSKPFGLVELSARGDIASDYQFIDENGSPKEKIFFITINNRSCLWRYRIISKGDDFAGSDLRIKRENNNRDMDCRFLKEDRRTDENEKEATFISDSDIPLYEKPTKNIELQINRNGDGFITLISHLPNPKPSTIEVDSLTKRIYSDIFVYV